MLAQNFMAAEALGIPETHRQALMKTLVLLETGKLVHDGTDMRAIMRYLGAAVRTRRTPLAPPFRGGAHE